VRPGDLPHLLAIARARPAQAGLHVYYGRDRLPARDGLAHGGIVKLQSLSDAFPNAPRRFNLLYLVSSALPTDAQILVRLAARRGAAVVLNQNGVAYPGWYGPGYERVNAPRARILHAADHVVYQSEFCRISADRFYGARHGPSDVLHNPVDVRRFTPGSVRRDGLVLLLGGSQYQRYRFDVALETLVRLEADVRLVVTGELSWHADRQQARREAAEGIEQLGLGDRVELTGPYAQRDAPDVFRRADVLLHTKYNDPCPTVVLEAMACGLPIVYSASGGTPELVGPDAGIGVEAPLDWEQDHPPAPEALADGVRRIRERIDEYAEAARTRAETFNVDAWLARHRALFEQLVR